ncbi:MAG: hypothetical protein ABIA78_01410 [archaeon]
MKKRALLVLVILLFVNVVSASYNCSIGEIITDSKIIYVGEMKSVNDVDVALVMSHWESVAEFLLDAQRITLTNASLSKDIELLSGNYKISLINITENYAWIKVGGDKKRIEKDKFEKVGDLHVYTLDFEGIYPGEEASLELFVGSKYIFIYNKNPSSTETISGVEYLIEVPSSSNDEALISIKKCENGTIIKVEDPVEEVIDDFDNSSLSNDEVQNESENKSLNKGGFEVLPLGSEEKNISQSNFLKSLIKNNLYVIIIIITLSITLFYFIKKKK